MSNAEAREKGGARGQPTIQIKVQTPRGLWSMEEPDEAKKRPDYDISTKIETVIADVRSVFNFVEQDSKYTLFLGKTELKPDRTLASYQIKTGDLLVLSVQGGNA
jgi:hypothetical protein